MSPVITSGEPVVPAWRPPPDEVVRRLELTVLRRLDGLLQGDYRGLVPGHGAEPGETRPYEPGDDVRRIDWNVTARMQSVHLRESIADHELELYLVMDLSPSLSFGTANSTKRTLALDAAGTIALLANRSGNRIGAVIGTGGGEVLVPARTGRQALLSMLHRIGKVESRDGSGAVDLAGLMSCSLRTARRRGLVVVVSDFLDGGPWDRSLRMLVQRHDVVAIEVLDPRELDLPDVGLLMVRDPETGRVRDIDTRSSGIRERYRAAAEAQRTQIKARIRRTGASHLRLRTDGDWLLELAQFVSRRKHLANVGGRP